MLLRDFVLERRPERARLLIMVDQEYQLFLNGRRVGAGRIDGEGTDREPDAYDVAALLVEGKNRLVVEARSRFLYGGILASLEFGSTGAADSSGRSAIVTDDSWKIVTEHQEGLIAGFVEPRLWQRARAWDRPPTGRWPPPKTAPSQAIVPPGTPPEAILVSRVERVQVSLVVSDRASGLETDLPVAESTGPQWGFLLDFGKVVEGHLELWAQGQQPRLTQSLPVVSFGEEPPSLKVDPQALHAETQIAMVFVDQRPFWRDAERRRFRYALVSRSVPIVHAQVSDR